MEWIVCAGLCTRKNRKFSVIETIRNSLGDFKQNPYSCDSQVVSFELYTYYSTNTRTHSHKPTQTDQHFEKQHLAVSPAQTHTLSEFRAQAFWQFLWLLWEAVKFRLYGLSIGRIWGYWANRAEEDSWHAIQLRFPQSFWLVLIMIMVLTLLQYNPHTCWSSLKSLMMTTSIG